MNLRFFIILPFVFLSSLIQAGTIAIVEASWGDKDITENLQVLCNEKQLPWTQVLFQHPSKGWYQILKPQSVKKIELMN